MFVAIKNEFILIVNNVINSIGIRANFQGSEPQLGYEFMKKGQNSAIQRAALIILGATERSLKQSIRSVCETSCCLKH